MYARANASERFKEYTLIIHTCTHFPRARFVRGGREGRDDSTGYLTIGVGVAMKRERDAFGGSRDPYIMRGGACDLCGFFFETIIQKHLLLFIPFGTTKVHPGHSRDKALLHLVKVPRRWIKKLKGPFPGHSSRGNLSHPAL